MMRRLIPNPAHRPCRRTTSINTSIGSFRFNSGDAAIRSHLDNDASAWAHPSSRGVEIEGVVTARQLSSVATRAPSLRGNRDFLGSSSRTDQDVMMIPLSNGIRGGTAQPSILPPSSRGFEIQGISTRQLSSEAIQVLSPVGNNAFFGSSAENGEDVMLNPFLNGLRGENSKKSELPVDSIAFEELFKAISTLNKEPTSTDLSTLNVENNTGGIEPCDRVEDEKVDIDDAAAFISEEEIRESRRKELANAEMERHRMSCNLGLALKRNPYESECHEAVGRIFEEARRSPHDLLKNKQITKIFYYLVKTDVSAGYDVLKYHVARCKEQGKLADLDMYQNLIHRIRSVELYNAAYYRHNTKTRPMTLEELEKFAGDITQHIQEEYSDGKKMVYQYLLLPELVLSLSCHRNVNINRCAKPVMEYILDAQFPQLNPDLYEHMMGLATQSKTGSGFLPYHRVLSQLVLDGYRPKPENVINLLHCYQPFNDTEATHVVLSAIKRLHPDDVSSPPAAAEDYRIDLGTLESISMASARNSIELKLLVWDMVELFGYNPTESMFEDVIMSFAATKQDENVFSALVDMEKNGFVPSQVLLRYVALKLAWSKTLNRLNHSNKMLSWHGNEHMRSTHSMNALMMGYGMKKDINSAFSVYESLARFNLKPDIQTFSFLMGILYIDTKERYPYQAHKPMQFNPEDIDDVLGAAQIILDATEEEGIGKTNHFIYEYIRVLLAIGLREDAYLVFEEAIRAGMSLPVGSIFLLATRFADSGEFEMARVVAKSSAAAGCGELPNLLNRIKNIKKDQRSQTKEVAPQSNPS